ncbi:restriction endonuclease subunit S [Enterococcus faecium]|uniref:restriction endonuclease subunit S n=1 Tax=Enterococcus faecium TaxID=1352 RepID=UPI001C7DAD97|nr:restriction endonuclease subunit S [Enterococcus faecium]MBX4203382.1 restriction endonuclease subunit S [Enterococcus faecium]
MINTKALREKILDLAMRGKLVSQDPTDEPASVLLDKIKKEKEQLIKDKKIKKEKSLPEISKEEIPYEIPDSWEWVRIGCVLIETIGGGTPSKSNPNYWNGSIPWASVKDIRNSTLDTTKDFITEEGLKNSSSNYIKKNNLIIATRMAVGKIAINKIDMTINQDLRALIINKSILKKYIFYIYPRIQFETKGITVKGFTINELLNKPFALPPLAEQKRIVAKIEELFALIDTIESNQLEFKQLAEQLDKKVLDLAMRGKLVPQDPTDEPASVLLDKIKEEKVQLIKDKKIKKEKALPEISKEEIPYEIPDSWEWTRLGDSIQLLSGRDLANDQYSNKETGIPYITGASNFSCNHIDSVRWTESPKVEAVKGDILLTVKGTVGSIAILTMDKVHIARQIVAIRNITKKIDSKYVYWFISYYVKYLQRASKGVIPGISRKDILDAIMPIPPLNEQKRIVTKIEMIRESIQRIDFE